MFFGFWGACVVFGLSGLGFIVVVVATLHLIWCGWFRGF